MKKPHRILFIGSNNELLKKFSEENVTEVVSSASFVDLVLQRFVPEFIIFDSYIEDGVKAVRQNEKTARIPVLITEKDFSQINNFSAISYMQKVLVCNTAIAQGNEFFLHLDLLMDKKIQFLSSKTSIIVKYAILFMNKNFSKSLTREDIARQVGVNEDYLTRIFRKEMGVSLWTYLTELRLDFARRQLLYAGEKIENVAKKSGFSRTSYFTNVFKKRYGVSPSDLRHS